MGVAPCRTFLYTKSMELTNTNKEISMSRKMRVFTVRISITGLGGTREQDLQIKATKQNVAERKAYEVIGNQTGHIVSVIDPEGVK